MAEFAGERVRTGLARGRSGAYERKVDLPQSGSPRRRMVIVGGSSINRHCWAL